jgi:hypothetical protein
MTEHRVRTAILVAAVSLLLSVLATQGRQEPLLLDTSHWAPYRDPHSRWILRYPSHWYTQPYGDHSDTQGLLLSNVAFHFTHPHPKDYRTTAWDMRGLPSNGVVVRIGFGDFGIAIPGPPWTDPPLRLSDAQKIFDHPPFGSPQPRLFLPLSIPHQPHNYFLSAWFAKDASAMDRRIADLIARSIRFHTPRLRVISDRATPGSTVTLRGFGFSGEWRSIAKYGGWGISLFGKCPGGRPLSAQTNERFRVDEDGALTGWFRVPLQATCVSSTGAESHPAMPEGRYRLAVGCAQCDLAGFSVTRSD